MSGDLIALKFKSKDGHIVTFQLAEILEIDGVPFNRFTSIESVRVETDELVERAILDLQQRVKALEEFASPPDGGTTKE